MVFIFSLFAMLLLNSCSQSPNKKTNGYIEGRYTYIATNASGFLEKLHVRKGHVVKTGQLLFTLDEQPELSQLNIAEENLKQAYAAREEVKAQLELAKSNSQRYQVLATKNAIEKTVYEAEKAKHEGSIAELDAAQANIAAKTAALAEARWMKDQKIGTAPVSGLVFDIYYRKGEYTVAQKPILSLLAPEDIKAIFYIPQTDLSRVHLDDKVMINCDGCRHLYVAHISYISPTAEYTPPVIYSAETNSKLVYRIEANFEPRDAYHLHPGQPIYISYNVND